MANQRFEKIRIEFDEFRLEFPEEKQLIDELRQLCFVVFDRAAFRQLELFDGGNVVSLQFLQHSDRLNVLYGIGEKGLSFDGGSASYIERTAVYRPELGERWRRSYRCFSFSFSFSFSTFYISK